MTTTEVCQARIALHPGCSLDCQQRAGHSGPHWDRGYPVMWTDRADWTVEGSPS